MKKSLLLAAGLAASLIQNAGAFTTTAFQPGHLAVLQLGNGGTNRCLPLGAVTGITNYTVDDIMGSRQTPLFIDQFDPNGVNQTVASVQVAIPTNGPGAMMINGNAGTEGNLTLAGDKSVLAFTGYQGDILSITTGGQTAPSNLSYDRGIGTLDAFTNYANPYRGGGWYGIATGKTNPRGVATDGAGHFWGCGNGYGSLYYDATTGDQPIQFQNIALTSCSKVINGRVYSSIKAKESVNLYPAGVYSFVDFFNNPVDYPSSASFLHLEIPAAAPYNTCIGFDINPQNNVAYLADTTYGVQKYVKTGLSWQLAYNLAIPGYIDATSRTNFYNNPNAATNFVGAFSLTVDWSGTNPVIYATTSDCGQDSGDPYYGNRVIRINDTNTVVSGASLTNFDLITTVARPPLDANGLFTTNLVYKSVAFTPDLRPVITSSPANWSAVVGDNVSFNLSAYSSSGNLTYQWLQNGAPLAGQTADTLNLSAVTAALDNAAYQCVAMNNYGAVTSAIATLTVSVTAQAPVLGAVQNLTNYIGNDQIITVAVGGTDPKGGYQWYFNGNPLSDGPTGTGSTLAGTTSSTLQIRQVGTGDQGQYSVSVTNVAGNASNLVANLYTIYAPPLIVQPPVSLTTFFGTAVTNTVSAYGQALTYQWFTSTKSTAPTSLKPLADGAEFSGTATANLSVAANLGSDITNYCVVVSNPSGSVTSAPVTLKIITQPAHSFVMYSNNGAVYAQNFDSLPVNAGSSADAANPVGVQTATNFTVVDLTTAGPLNTYSVANPFDFAYPILPQGSIGGLGLGGKMDGWYAWASTKVAFGATFGDQSAGGIIDNGLNYRGDGTSLVGVTNRALGIISTTKSGYTAFAVALVNRTTNTLNYANISFTGELWRNNPNQQVLGFSYAIDPAGTGSTFSPGTPDGSIVGSLSPVAVHGLDVAFLVSAATSINDGTQSTNQTVVSTNSMTLAGGWAPGSTLWLIWESQNPIGGAQDVAIDNLQFSASASPIGNLVTPITIPPGSVQFTGAGAAKAITFGFTNGSGLSFSVLATNNLTAPASTWPVIGQAVESPVGSGNYQFADPNPATNGARYYLLRQP